MSGKLEVSFNSPQCGWMSIGFEDGSSEFHTTTSYAPYPNALADILKGLASLIDKRNARDEFVIAWSRNPEEYDLFFQRDGDNINFRVVEYPTLSRSVYESETVFTHEGNVTDFCKAFYRTFVQLYEEKSVDEFEFNWHQPFPFREYEEFRSKITTK